MKARTVLEFDRPFLAAGTAGRKPGLSREYRDLWSAYHIGIRHDVCKGKGSQ